MKYAILVLAAVVLSFSAQAQTNKQVAGSKSMEVQFAPLSGNPIGINGIKFRSFSTETTAFRITANVSYGTDSDPIFNEDGSSPVNFGGDDIDLNSKATDFAISVRPGLEWHLPGTDKLSPYYGGEVLISYSSSSMSNEYNDIELNDMGGLANENIETRKTSASQLALGLNGVGGMDYYFAQNIFLGAEFGFGLQFTNEGAEKFEDSGDSENDSETTRGSNFELGPNFVGQLRLGIIF